MNRPGKDPSDQERQIAALIYGGVSGLLVGGGSMALGQPGSLAIACGALAAVGGIIFILFFV